MSKSRPGQRPRRAEATVAKGTTAPEVQAAGAALLVVDRTGAVLRSSGWADLFGDAAPSTIATDGDSGDELLGAVAAIAEEAARSGVRVRRCVPISLDRHRYYHLSAGPLVSAGPPEAPGDDAGTTILAVEITDAFKAGPKEGEAIRQLGHDLRTPLTSMSAAAELLRQGRLGSLSPEQGKLIGMLEQGIDLMLSLIDEATAVYRAAASGGPGLQPAAPERGAAR